MVRRPRAAALLCAVVVVMGCLAGAGPLPARAASPTPTCGTRCTIAPAKPLAPERAAPGSYVLSFSGQAVSFDLSGMEPDFDPIYKVVVTGTLRDERTSGQALPDATLVLSAYLEAFQPDTTPLLPDLLHPNQTATDLGGFLTGKAALVNRGGRTVYHGDLLSEIFVDSTEHMIIDLYPSDAGPNAPAIRLQGAITLKKGGTEQGTLRALKPLARAALDVPRGSQPSWQSVISGLSVKVPAMLGTAGTPGQSKPGSTVAPVGNLTQGKGSSAGIQRFILPMVGVGLLAIALGLFLTWRDVRRQRAQPPPDVGHRLEQDVAAGSNVEL